MRRTNLREASDLFASSRPVPQAPDRRASLDLFRQVLPMVITWNTAPCTIRLRVTWRSARLLRSSGQNCDCDESSPLPIDVWPAICYNACEVAARHYWGGFCLLQLNGLECQTRGPLAGIGRASKSHSLSVRKVPWCRQSRSLSWMTNHLSSKWSAPTSRRKAMKS